MSIDSKYQMLRKTITSIALIACLLPSSGIASSPAAKKTHQSEFNYMLQQKIKLKTQKCKTFTDNSQIADAEQILFNELAPYKDSPVWANSYYQCLRDLIAASMNIDAVELDTYIPLAEGALKQDNLSITNRINMMFSLGLAYYQFKDDFKKGLDLFAHAQLYIDQNKDVMSHSEYRSSKIMSLRQQAMLYWSLEDWDNAERSYRLALEFNKKNNHDLAEEAEDWHSLAIVLLYSEKYRESYNAILKNIDINHRLNSDDVSGERGIMNGIIAGHVLGKLGEFGQAEHYFHDAIKLSSAKETPPYYNALTHSYYALFKVSEGDFIASEYQLQLVDDVLSRNFDLQTSWEDNDAYLEAKYKTLQHLGEHQSALEAFQRFHNITIRGFRERESKHLSKIIVEHEVALNINNSKRLERENEIKQLKLQQQMANNQKLAAAGYVAGIIFLIILAFFIRERHNRKKMHAMTMIDPLTLSPNRKAILDVAHHVVKSTHGTRNAEKSLSIGLLNIDNFKRINDTFGHDVGDTIIKDVVSTLLPILRDNDHIGRYGGEEFLLLLPNANKAQTEAIFQRLQSAVSQKVFSYNNKLLDLNVTLSMGAIIEHGRDDVVLKDENIRIRLSKLIKVADDMLHKAKSAGKNQLVCV